MVFSKDDPPHSTNDISFTFYYFVGEMWVRFENFCHSKFDIWPEVRSYNLIKGGPSKSVELGPTGKYTQYKSESNLNNEQCSDEQKNSKVNGYTKSTAEENIGNLCFSIFDTWSSTDVQSSNEFFTTIKIFITDTSSPSKIISSNISCTETNLILLHVVGTMIMFDDVREE